MPIFAAPTFATLNRREAELIERYVPAGPPPRPLLLVNVAANGSRLWFGIAALLALRPALRRTAAEGVVAALLAAGTTQVVNRLVGRPRPSADHPARRALPHQPGTPAFPSSHTAVAAAFTTAVARRSPRLGAALVPLALTLAYGRVRLRVHWPTDVLGGAAAGMIAGRSAQRGATAIRAGVGATDRFYGGRPGRRLTAATGRRKATDQSPADRPERRRTAVRAAVARRSR